MDMLCDTPATVFDVKGLGPAAALKALVSELPESQDEKEIMWQRARVAAVMGSCPKTRESFRSGGLTLIHATSRTFTDSVT